MFWRSDLILLVWRSFVDIDVQMRTGIKIDTWVSSESRFEQTGPGPRVKSSKSEKRETGVVGSCTSNGPCFSPPPLGLKENKRMTIWV